MSFEGMRAYAMRLLLLIIHMNTSGMLCWGLQENKQENVESELLSVNGVARGCDFFYLICQETKPVKEIEH